MFNKKIMWPLLFAWQISSSSAAIDKIDFTCPSVNEVNEGRIKDGNMYQYNVTAYVNYPPFNSKLYFTGKASAPIAHYFFGATWTDLSFLCLYDYVDDPIIIFETQLAPYVPRCYFKNGTDRPRDECNGIRETCQLTCELPH